VSLEPGKNLGAYEVLSKLGEGGMGQVWRARDTQLNRDVALKVLPEAFAADGDRLSRFTREAQTLAALNHPNIAAIYGLEKAGDCTALVMELVEGEDLSAHIARGPIPAAEAVLLAKQIAEALEAAHEQGIIHRDLKPANIKVRSDGTVKVLDFGLAKSLGPTGAAEATPYSAANSPTLTARATQLGMILGTAAYMAPEQARGKAVDKRADIWAFGVVLYEMVTGQRAFKGDDITETLASVMKDTPDLSAVPASAPARLRTLIGRCLERDVRQRLRDIGEARVVLDRILTGVEGDAVAPSAATHAIVPAWRRVGGLMAGALAVAAVTGTAVWLTIGSTVPDAPELRLEIAEPSVAAVTIAISPDGRRVVFTSTTTRRLVVRSLADTTLQPLPGTDGATFPFWSPDSQSLGFFADGKLKRIDIAAGTVQTVTNASGSARGGTWNRDDVMLFAPSAASAIFRVSAAGGEPAKLTTLQTPAQADHRAPQFLPDGQHFLFYARGTADGRGVYVGGLDGSQSPRLIDADAGAVYTASGHLLFVRAGTLFGVRFDLDRLALAGDPFPVAEQVIVNPGISMAALSASAAGPIIYVAGVTGSEQLAWLDRSGKIAAAVGDPGAGFLSPALSPDGQQLVGGRNTGSTWDLYVRDLTRGVERRLTSDSTLETYPVWSPDGSRIVFFSAAKGLVMTPVAGAEQETVLQTTPVGPLDWSNDGRFLLYGAESPTTGQDLWARPMAGDATPVPVASSRFNERGGQFSPDGRWVAYTSDESGRSEIFVQPFPGPGTKTQVSTAGGAQVRWRRDGKELFYVALDAQLMAVPMQLPSSGANLTVGRPVPLFAARIGAPLHAVSLDGQQFLMMTGPEVEVPPISIILNWKPKS